MTRAPLLYGVLPALLLSAGLALAAGLRLARAPGKKRLLVGALVAGGLLVFAGAGLMLTNRVRQGVWFCDVCGRHERQVRVWGRTLERQAIDVEAPEAWRTHDYVLWYDAHAALEHEHGWSQAGEHVIGFGQPFTMYDFAPTYHRALPRVPDAEVARALVARLAHASLEERWSMLRDFASRSAEVGPPALMRALARGPVAPEEFTTAYPGWLAEHPLWAP